MLSIIKNTVREFAKRRGYNGNIDNEDNLFSIGIDSLDIMEIIMSVENQTGTKVSDDRIVNIHTIKDILNLFETEE